MGMKFMDTTVNRRRMKMVRSKMIKALFFDDKTCIFLLSYLSNFDTIQVSLLRVFDYHPK